MVHKQQLEYSYQYTDPMNNTYQILWIDDEWEKMSSFLKYCKFEYNIELTPFKTQKEGLDAYAQNPTFWEGIILDAKVLDESVDEVAHIKNLYKAVTRLQTEFKNVPFFISTGQPDLLSQDDFEYYCQNTFSHRYYEKVNDDEQLCKDILTAAEEKSQRQIKNKYPEIFSWLPAQLYSEILDLLTIVESGDNKNTNIFNNIRKVLDWIMVKLNEYGILAINFSGTNLNDCSRFLSSEELKEFVPQYMQRQIHSCCTIANEGSHRLTTDEDVRSGVAPFLVRSTIFELLNILMWMHQLPEDDNKRRLITNKAVSCAAKFKKEEPASNNEPQEPIFDEELKVWHCGDTMLSIKFWDRGKVELRDKQENTSTNPRIKEKYPYFAKYKKI